MSYQPAYKTARKPLIDPKFTKDREAWPKGPTDKACIFEAIEIVGKAKFGSEWAGDELRALNWPIQPREAHEESLRPAPMNSGGGAPGSRPHYTPTPSIARLNSPKPVTVAEIFSEPNAHVWAFKRERLVSVEQAAWLQNEEARNRLFDAFDWLAQRCRDGDIVAFARPEAGGGLYPMMSSEWNVDRALERFVSEGSFKRFFPEFKQSWSAYAFFDRMELNQAIAMLQHSGLALPPTELGDLSPFLRLAVIVARRRGYTSPDADEKQPIREAEVRAAWEKEIPDIPRSDTAIRAIAKVIGFPDPTAILQGMSAKRGQSPKNK